MLEEKFSRHFFVVHTFVSEEARLQYLTPPEKRDPPEPRTTERQWAMNAIGEYAQCMQTWCGNDDFFYCHWIAESEEDVYRQTSGTNQKLFLSLICFYELPVNSW